MPSQGRDVLGIAQTGTGKTAAFTLPMLSLLEKGRARARMPRTLILEPTRELAAQVEEAFGKYGVNHKLNLALLIGGVSFGDQEAKITRGADVLIATPGRLLDFVDRGKILLTGIEILVIDEADRMLDMGFIPDIERICKLVPFTRQTLFFSATMPPEITRLTETFLHNPVRVEVARAASTAERHHPDVWCARASRRKKSARRCAGSSAAPRTSRTRSSSAIASATCRSSIARWRSMAFPSARCMAISTSARAWPRSTRSATTRSNCSSVPTSRRAGSTFPTSAMSSTTTRPHHAEDYVHRIGRTGRAGKKRRRADDRHARAISAAIDDIEKLINKKIDWQGGSDLSVDEDAEVAVESEDRSGRRQSRSRGGRTEHARGQAEHSRGQAEHPRGRAEHSRGQAEHPRTQADRPHGEDRRPRPERPERDARPAPSRRPRREEDDAPVIGLGDHIPSFLLRPVRPRPKVHADAED